MRTPLAWRKSAESIARYLFIKGETGTEKRPPAIELAEAQKVVEQEKGELSLAEQVALVKFATLATETILGSHAFVESYMASESGKSLATSAKGVLVAALKILGQTTLALGLSQAANPGLRLIAHPTSDSPAKQQSNGLAISTEPSDLQHRPYNGIRSVITCFLRRPRAFPPMPVLFRPGHIYEAGTGPLTRRPLRSRRI